MTTWCEEPTRWKTPWCWGILRAGGEGDNGGWDGWMASPTQWAWDWIDSGSWWWTGRPGVLQFHGVAKSQTRLSNWTELNNILKNQINVSKTTRECLDYSQFKSQTSISDLYWKGRNALLSHLFLTLGLPDLFLTMGTIGFIRFLGFKYKNSAYLHMLYVNNISIKLGEEKLYLIHQHHSSTLSSRWST